MRYIPVLLLTLLVSCQKPTAISGDLVVGEELLIPMRDGKNLSASLLKGPGEKNPTIVIIVGSGDFSYRTYWIPKTFGIWKIIAESFVSKGYSVLLLEKRGINKSEGNWKKNDLNGRADDVADAIDYLKGRDDIDQNRIGLCGHSQGGWVAQLAAATYPDKVSFVISLAGPAISVKQQVLRDHTSEWFCEGLTTEEIDRKAVKKMKSLNRLENLSKTIKTGHLSRIIGYDPGETIAKIECPVLAIYSENDQLVDPQENIEAFRSSIVKEELLEIITIDSANHFFISAGLCTPWSELKPSFAPEFDSLISNWDFLERLEK